MKGDDFVGHLPGGISWSPDNEKIYFNWNPDQALIGDEYYYDLQSETIVKIEPEKYSGIIPEGEWDSEHNKMVYSKNGDLFIYDSKSDEHTQITNTIDYESGPEFSADNKQIVFRNGNNLFTWNIENGSVIQLTDIQNRKEPRDSKNSAQEEFLMNEEEELFQTVSQNKARKELREERSELSEPKRPKTIYTDDKIVRSFDLSPDQRFIAYSLFDRAESRDTKMMDQEYPRHLRKTGIPG
ncbi:MAG: hypothetical protein P8X57_06695 [Cyclobacteriaceae bacterium]